MGLFSELCSEDRTCGYRPQCQGFSPNWHRWGIDSASREQLSGLQTKGIGTKSIDLSLFSR